MHYYPTHTTEFAGFPVLEWNPDTDPIENPAGHAFAIRTDWEDYDTNATAWLDKFTLLMGRPYAREIPALIVGMWGSDGSSVDTDQIEAIVQAIAAHRDQLPRLKGLFIGDIVSEENEISWIHQGDLSPLVNAFPNLEYFTIRGGDRLRLGPMFMPQLKALRIESGGLDAAVVRSVGAGTFPKLESLILWLGTQGYGATATLQDLRDFYQCAGMPKLRYLGLNDSDMADEIAAFIATAPVLARIETLDLSMGTLSDEGALALLTSPYVRQLKALEIHHHFCSDAMVAKLGQLALDGVTVNISDQQRDDRDWRFVAVGE
jgi:hypothetical protein